MRGKLPINTCEQDPGWWSDGPPYNNSEVDFPEFYGAGSKCTATSGWKGIAYYYAAFGSPHPILVQWERAFDPSAAFHTYTFEVTPAAAGKFKFRAYVDGQLLSLQDGRIGCYSESCAVTESVETAAESPERLNLVLDESLRDNGQTIGFKSGDRTFYVETTAVYEDAPHKDVGVGFPGIAPGTVVK